MLANAIPQVLLLGSFQSDTINCIYADPENCCLDFQYIMFSEAMKSQYRRLQLDESEHSVPSIPVLLERGSTS